MDKLAALDQETPIRVQCLAGGETVFCQDLPLRDLLAGLRYTTAGRHAVLYFSLAGGLGVHGGQGQGCPVLFCNSKRVGSRPKPPQEDQAVRVPEAGQEAGPAPEAGQVVAASPGKDGLGLWVSAPSPEEGQKEARRATTPAEDEGAGLVLRGVGKGVVTPSPPPQRQLPQPGKARQGRGRAGSRLSHGLWDNLLAIAQTLSLTLVVYSALLEYFPD
ncbi:uncharacterized protein LOC135092358 [Scylla paramamosain]|uniref:uncharacterized protein LOC135092358 n=1 Tax=Scylla paramamosain TaxID=85552 RepID=UPI0030833C2C